MGVHVHIENMFSVPIYTSHIDIPDFNIEDIKFLPNNNNIDDGSKLVWISENTQLLETDNRFSEIKRTIDDHMFHFYEDVLGYEIGDVYPVMTTSWLVESSPGHESIVHLHGNSIFSGVLYMKVPENSGDITFKRQHNFIPYLSPPIKNKTPYNTSTRSLYVKEGLLLLFPSIIEHKIEKNLSNDKRYSIAFNYFLKGNFKTRTGDLILG